MFWTASSTFALLHKRSLFLILFFKSIKLYELTYYTIKMISLTLILILQSYIFELYEVGDFKDDYWRRRQKIYLQIAYIVL